MISFKDYIFEASESSIPKKIKDENSIQPWSELLGNESLDNKIGIVIDYVKKHQILDKFESYLKLIKKNKTNTHMYGLKSNESIENKIMRKAGTTKDNDKVNRTLSRITDIVRGCILFNTDADVEEAVERILKNKKGIPVEYTKKTKGSNEWGYFGSHHFLIKINGVICELQICTKHFWRFKKIGHKYYEKYRLLTTIDPSITDTDEYKKTMQLSKRTFSKGNIQFVKTSKKYKTMSNPKFDME